MDSQGSVREGRQGLCRLHPCYLCGNQCQERHQHQRSVHRDKWVCFSNKWHLWPLTPLRLCNVAFKYLSTTELDCFSRSCEREIQQTRLLHSEDLTLWELRAFCHQTYFFPVAHISSSPFCCQSSRDPLRCAVYEFRSCAMFSSTRVANLISVKWFFCYLSD